MKLPDYMSKARIKKAIDEGQLFTRIVKTIRRELQGIKLRICDNIKYFFNKQIRDSYLNSLPVEDKILFCSCQGNYSDNPKYILEELIKQGKDYEVVWLCSKDALSDMGQFPSAVSKVVLWETAEAYKELATSKIIIVNSVELFYRPFHKKDGQVIIETWHGSLGIKRFDREVNPGVAWCDAGDNCAAVCDYLISNSDFEDDIYRMSFWHTTPILKYGHPRCDIFFNTSDAEREAIKVKVLKACGYEYKGENLFLYGPTFRESHGFDCYDLDAQLISKAFEERFGGKWIGLYRYHPNLRKIKGDLNSEYIVDVTSYIDMQEVALIADAGISDYSSWLYDFVLTDRPAFIYAKDKDLYGFERGLAFELEETPFPIATDNQQMVENILSFDNDNYQMRRKEFITTRGSVEDGQASKRVVKKIDEIMEVNFS